MARTYAALLFVIYFFSVFPLSVVVLVHYYFLFVICFPFVEMIVHALSSIVNEINYSH